MGLPKAAISSFGCNTCRRAIAHSIAPTSSSAGLTPVAHRRATIIASSRSAPAVQRFPFSSLPVLNVNVETSNSDTLQAAPTGQTSEPTSTTKPLADPLETPPPSTSPPIPWYLQNRPLPTPQQPAIIPDLPPNPPPLLKPLLEYISITAGLDDLLLLDLRHLDPPPALGPKLIMIIGTARSEKHLHVSADRFCRHLRREYKLKANAAGLLGRNELKIKLRRKAKRMKMLANVGGAEPEGNIDDGIRTGWICCTIGKIEAHPEDSHMPGDNVQEFVGFRDVKPGVNVVVQMFTEEKRAETDLETLWGGVLKTHERKDQNAEDALKELIEKVDQADQEEATLIDRKNQEPTLTVSPPVQRFHRPRPTTGDVFPPASELGPRRQLRRLYTVGLRP